MNLLQLQRGSKQFGPKTLFDQASFAVNEGEHIGVIGPNGAGKSTLFKILVGQESLDEGVLTKSQNLRIGYLEQEAEWELGKSSEDYLQENCLTPIWELKQLGTGLGLTEAHFASPLASLSGGYRMRMKLLSLIGQEPQLMLLDEPTNFLDLESVLALENFLQSYSGAFLLISHDREFLRRTTEATLEVESGDITKFPGHIDDYFEQKSQLRAVQEAQSANLELKRKSIQNFIDRFRAKASKAKQAQSRMKQLDKMENIELKDLPVRARIQIPAPIHTGKETLLLSQADLGYQGKTILSKVNLRLERGDHLGVVGHNGAGKSTLLKSLAGHLPLIHGERTLGYQVSLSHFSQHSAEQLDMDDDVLGSLQKTAHKEITAQEILNMAGTLLFSGDDVKKKVKMLSGGEKARVALGQILLKKSPLLLLDEPTNHLDFETVETLTEAVRDYAGSVIVVSHDRSFIGRVATKILEIDHGKVEVYPGTYDEYVWSLQKGALSDRHEQKKPTESPLAKKSESQAPSSHATNRTNYKEQTKKLGTEIKGLDKEISTIEGFLSMQIKRRDSLTEKLITSQGPEARDLSFELNQCSAGVTEMEEKMLELLEKKEQKEKELSSLKDQK
jgi:ATP-binding cassette, subfamily F, member 3